MGRKKRKAVVETAPSAADDDEDLFGGEDVADELVAPAVAPSTYATVASAAVAPATAGAVASDPRLAERLGREDPRQGDDEGGKKTASSGYAMTTHSAEIIDADIYVSDGSESDEDLQDPLTTSPDGGGEEPVPDERNPNRAIQMVLSGSRMGLMRRGIHHPSLLVQPNRQWSRQNPADTNASGAGGEDVGNGDGQEEGAAAAEERRKREQEEELAKLDPAQRAARLLAEKQRKLEEAKVMARKLESEENAGRDPCLFSKRTSFDIRFDQIDDKPWVRGGDMVSSIALYRTSQSHGRSYLIFSLRLVEEPCH
jgi:hypothetical protein